MITFAFQLLCHCLDLVSSRCFQLFLPRSWINQHSLTKPAQKSSSDVLHSVEECKAASATFNITIPAATAVARGPRILRRSHTHTPYRNSSPQGSSPNGAQTASHFASIVESSASKACRGCVIRARWQYMVTRPAGYVSDATDSSRRTEHCGSHVRLE